MNTYADVATLLQEIRGISNELQVSVNVYDALDEAKGRYFRYYQETSRIGLLLSSNIVDTYAVTQD